MQRSPRVLSISKPPTETFAVPHSRWCAPSQSETSPGLLAAPGTAPPVAQLSVAGQKGRPRSARSFLDTERSLSGMQPDSVLPPRYTLESECRLPNSEGMSPVSWLSYRSRDSSLESLPSTDGIGPLSRLRERSTAARLARSPNHSGIPPLSWLFPMRSTLRLAS